MWMHVDACGMQVDAYVDVASGVVNAGNIVPAFTLWSFFLVFVIQNFNNQTHIHFFFLFPVRYLRSAWTLFYPNLRRHSKLCGGI